MPKRVHKVRMDAQGRLVMPLPLREALDLRDGGELLFSVHDGVLQAQSRTALLGQIRREVAAMLPSGAVLLDDMLAGRMSGHGR